MQRNKIKTDIATFTANTYNSKDHYLAIIERAAKVLADPDSIKRVKASECLVCFYGSRIGGACCASQRCGLCDKEMSTCTDNFCLECARQNDLCKHCGGDIDLKYRRKTWPAANTSES